MKNIVDKEKKQRRCVAKCSADSPWVRGFQGAADYLGIGLTLIKEKHLEWEKFGCKTYKIGEGVKADVRFKKDELDRVPQPIN